MLFWLCPLLVRESGVGIHMWDVTVEQYSPGLGIVSKLHTFRIVQMARRRWRLTKSDDVSDRRIAVAVVGEAAHRENRA